MSITTLNLYESLLKHERPIAWWGLDTADPTVDDSGHGYTLTAVGAPANAGTLLTRGDSGASGSRDFGGAADAYFTAGTVTGPPDGFCTFVDSYIFTANSGVSVVTMNTPNGVAVGDLMLAVLDHGAHTATISAAPAGWTQVGTTLDYTSGALAIYKRTADAGDTVPHALSWTWSGASGTTAFLLAYRGLDASVSGLIFDSGQQTTASDVYHQTTTETYPDGASQIAIWAGNAGLITPDPLGATIDLDSQPDGNSPPLIVVRYEQTSSGSGFKWANTIGATHLGAAIITFGSPPQVLWDRLDTIATKLSIHALIQPDTISGSDTILRKHQAYGLQLNGGTVEFLYRDGGGVDRVVTGPSVSSGVTTHLVVVDDGATIHFYKNGAETTSARTGTAGYTQNTNRVEIGAYFDGATNANFFDGRIDEVAVWNTALTDQQVLAFITASTTGTFGTQLLGKTGVGNLPRFKLEVAWASNPSDDCFSFEDVTADARAISPTRGRNFETDKIETGRMDFTLDDRARRYDDQNASSPYYPNVTPTRTVRLRAQALTDGVVHSIFFGYTEGHPLRRGAYGKDEVAQFTASDSFMALALDIITAADARPQEFTGARLNHVLFGVRGVPYTGDEGQSLVIAADLLGEVRLEHAQSVTETEGGILFAARDGVVTFQDRHYRTKNERTVRAVYGLNEIPFTSIEPQFDEARLFTAAEITPASSNVQTAENAAASLAHFKRTKKISTLHAVDADAEGMANAYANRYSIPRTRIPQIQLQPTQTANWQTILGHEISHRIKTVDRPFGATVNREHFIEGIRHDITPETWRVSFSVSPAELDGDYLIIGTGKIGDASGATSAVIGW